MFDPHLGMAHLVGKSIALAAGFFAALSNLMVARAGRSNTSACVVFYFCFVSVFIHIPYFWQYGLIIPSGTFIWLAMIGAGLFASIGQLCMTKAYQLANIGKMTILGYFAPVFSLVWSVLFFHQVLTARSLIGCFIILVCGVFFSLLRNEKVVS
ncbi:MAG: DMT family transporter [Candidatus Parcubacteria bacterium]|nr:DMT family transporter [Candidatus Parcubacteria bacterium]